MIMATLRIINTHFSSSEKKKVTKTRSRWRQSEVRDKKEKTEEHHESLRQGEVLVGRWALSKYILEAKTNTPGVYGNG